MGKYLALKSRHVFAGQKGGVAREIMRVEEGQTYEIADEDVKYFDEGVLKKIEEA